MAAAAAEPGAAAAVTTTVDGGELEPVLAVPGAHFMTDETEEYAPAMDLVHQLKDGEAVQECGHVQMELVRRPDLEAAGKPIVARVEDEHIEAGGLDVGEKETSEHHTLEIYETGYTLAKGGHSIDLYSPVVEAAIEVSTKHEPYACHQNNVSSISDSVQSVVFLHSFPVCPPASEASLSLAEPDEPTVNYFLNPELTQHEIKCDYRAFTKPSLDCALERETCDDLSPGSECKDASPEDAQLERPQPILDHKLDSLLVAESEASPQGTSVETGYITCTSVGTQNFFEPAADQVSSRAADLVDSSSSSQQRFDSTNSQQLEMKSESNPPMPCQVGEVKVQPASVEQLTPGSEVQVSLDQITNDALVVSFRLGEKIFSGVLLDLSKRFGPYGIPITMFPKREYKDKPEPMQLRTEPPPQEPFQEVPPAQKSNPPINAVLAHLPQATDPSPLAPPDPSATKPHPWTSRPPPLFQEGAPYPPPLFIRDTYNQSLPQPPTRKIKRPKRRLYREEPTSIMNAIKLRPRQVLCDKCKGVVGGEKRETTPRRGPVSDGRGDDVKRRRSDNAGSSSATVSKRLRNDPREEKGRMGAETKRQAASSPGMRVSNPSSSLGHGRGGATGNRVLRGLSSSSISAALSSSQSTSSGHNSGSSRVQLNAKKVLQGKNAPMDRSKAHKVLKLARVQRKQTVNSSGTGTGSSITHAKTMTRAAALQEAHQNQKIHFTRRLQQISGMGPVNATPLPPRMRIKPQRYRNEENQQASSSPPKVPSPEKGQTGSRLTPPKPGSTQAKVPDPDLASALAPGSGPASAGTLTATPAPLCTPLPTPSTGLDPILSHNPASAPALASALASPPTLASALASTTALALASAPVLSSAPALASALASLPASAPVLASVPVFAPALNAALASASALNPSSPSVLISTPALISAPVPASASAPASIFALALVSASVPPPGVPSSTGEASAPMPQLEPELQPQSKPQAQLQSQSGDKVSTTDNLVVLMTLDPLPDSSTSRCSVDSADELKSSRFSECSSTETFEFPPPGENSHSPTPPSPPPAPSTSSSSGSRDDTDTPSPPTTASPPHASIKDEDNKKRNKSSKAAVFSKNVSKCVSVEGRTICVGDIVWAKIYGFPWWPARVVGISISRRDTGLLVRQEARVSWFGSPTTSFLPLTQLAPFLESFQTRFDKKRKGLYRKAITEAAHAAKQLTPEVRALLTQFETATTLKGC